MCDALQQLRTSFSTTIMLEDLKSFLQEEARVLEVGTKVEAIVGTLEEVRHETMLGLVSPYSLFQNLMIFNFGLIREAPQ